MVIVTVPGGFAGPAGCGAAVAGGSVAVVVAWAASTGAAACGRLFGNVLQIRRRDRDGLTAEMVFGDDCPQHKCSEEQSERDRDDLGCGIATAR